MVLCFFVYLRYVKPVIVKDVRTLCETPRFWLMFGETLAGFLGVGATDLHTACFLQKNGGMKQRTEWF